MPIETEKRLIDANLNRLREGIRVVEDIARYILNDFALASALKALRHKARIDNSAFGTPLLQHRDIKNDILKTSTPSEKRRENLRDIALANFKRSEESARVLEEIFKLDSAESQNLNKNNLCEAPENSPASWCKKSGEASSSGKADFLLEAEKRGSPPKSEKRQLLGTHFKKVGGSGDRGAALLREENKNNNGIAESSLYSIDSAILSQNGLPRAINCARNDEFIRDSAPKAQNDNLKEIAESSAICDIFKAIRYELYDIEIAYFKALETIEKIEKIER